MGREPETLGFSVMGACFLGGARTEVRERLGRFLSLREGDADPDTLLAERRDRRLVGAPEEVAGRIGKLGELGVTRVFLQHLSHSDGELAALIGERPLPALR